MSWRWKLVFRGGRAERGTGLRRNRRRCAGPTIMTRAALFTGETATGRNIMKCWAEKILHGTGR
ncbi:hypothetical protein ACLB1S_04020 [Escherichia coli]